MGRDGVSDRGERVSKVWRERGECVGREGVSEWEREG